MAAAPYHFTIEQGTLFERVLTYTSGLNQATQAPVNLTGYTARMKIKASGTLVLSLTTTPDAGGNVILLGGVLGTITIRIKSATTTTMNFDTAEYDLELLRPSDSEPSRLLKGTIVLDREVTD